MEQYIPKSVVLAEIKKLIGNPELIEDWRYRVKMEEKNELLKSIINTINTLEAKEVDTWHLQEKEDIYDVVKDWGLYKFVCIMKDGTIQRFNGSLDEDYEGHIHVHINGVNDDYDDVDDIVKWIELT